MAKVKLVDLYTPPTQQRDTSEYSQQQVLAEMLLKGNQPTHVYSNTAGALDVGSKMLGAYLSKRASEQEQAQDEQAWSAVQDMLARQSLGLDDAPSSSGASSRPPSGQGQPSSKGAAPSVVPRHSGGSGGTSRANASNERKRAAEAQAEGRPWEKFKSQDEGLKPWEQAKKQQEEAEAEQAQASEGDLKPWERAKREQELDLVRARARARMAQAQEGTSEARVQSDFEAMNPAQKAGRATMDIARLGLDGMTFGYGDKLLAGIEAAGRPDMDYDEALRLHRQATGDARTRAGYAGTAAEVGGALLPMGAAAKAGLSAARLVPQGLSGAKALGAKLVAGGVEGAGYGALHGAGHDQNVGDAASLGALGGIAGTGAAQAVGGVTNRLAQLLKRGKPKVPTADELTASAQAADASSPTMAEALRGRLTKSEAVESLRRETEMVSRRERERVTRILVERLPQTLKNLTPDELAAINDVAKGSLARKATRLTGDTLGGNASFVSALTGALNGYPGAVAAPVVGAGARVLTDRMTKGKVDRLAELMRAGGTREALTGPNNAAQRLAKTKRDLLARLLLSGALSGGPQAETEE
jgi:hypothetical protein